MPFTSLNILFIFSCESFIQLGEICPLIEGDKGGELSYCFSGITELVNGRFGFKPRFV